MVCFWGIFRIPGWLVLSPHSLGPWGYLVVRGDKAVLVDVPYHSKDSPFWWNHHFWPTVVSVWQPSFVKELEAAVRKHAPGGVSHLLLTHDDFVSRIVVGFSAFGPWRSFFRVAALRQQIAIALRIALPLLALFFVDWAGQYEQPHWMAEIFPRSCSCGTFSRL